VILALAARARHAKQPEMSRKTRVIRHLLRADAAVVGGEPDRLRRIRAQAARAFERQEIGGVRDDFRAANRRDDFILAYQSDSRARAQRRQWRELERFVVRGGAQQVAVELIERALIDVGRADEAVSLPLLLH